MNTLLFYNRLIELERKEAARLDYELSEINKYLQKENLTPGQIDYGHKRFALLQERYNDHTDRITLIEALYKAVDNERLEGHKSGIKAASKLNEPIDKEARRTDSIINAMSIWADHF